MKALQILSNVDRGKLIVDLFPSHLEDLVNYIEKKCLDIQENEAVHREMWNNGLATFDFYLHYVNEIVEVIKKLRDPIRKSRKVFAATLFYMYRPIITNGLIIEYAESSDDLKFNMAVALLFCEDNRNFTFFFNNTNHSNN